VLNSLVECKQIDKGLVVSHRKECTVLRNAILELSRSKEILETARTTKGLMDLKSTQIGNETFPICMYMRK